MLRTTTTAAGGKKQSGAARRTMPLPTSRNMCPRTITLLHTKVGRRRMLPRTILHLFYGGPPSHASPYNYAPA